MSIEEVVQCLLDYNKDDPPIEEQKGGWYPQVSPVVEDKLRSGLSTMELFLYFSRGSDKVDCQQWYLVIATADVFIAQLQLDEVLEDGVTKYKFKHRGFWDRMWYNKKAKELVPLDDFNILPFSTTWISKWELADHGLFTYHIEDWFYDVRKLQRTHVEPLIKGINWPPQ